MHAPEKEATTTLPYPRAVFECSRIKSNTSVLILAIDRKKAKPTAESQPEKLFQNQKTVLLPTGRLTNLGLGG